MLTSNVTPRYFWDETCKSLLLLKAKDGYGSFFHLRLKIPSWDCLIGSVSSFNSLAEAFTSWITEIKDLSSVKVLL